MPSLKYSVFSCFGVVGELRKNSSNFIKDFSFFISSNSKLIKSLISLSGHSGLPRSVFH